MTQSTKYASRDGTIWLLSSPSIEKGQGFFVKWGNIVVLQTAFRLHRPRKACQSKSQVYDCALEEHTSSRCPYSSRLELVVPFKDKEYKSIGQKWKTKCSKHLPIFCNDIGENNLMFLLQRQDTALPRDSNLDATRQCDFLRPREMHVRPSIAEF